MAWLEFVSACVLFFLTHSLPARPPLRSHLRAWLGPVGFTVVYSSASLAALVWVIGAARRAPYVQLWDVAVWQTCVPLVVMLPVCLIVTLSIAQPNPFSFGGARTDQFDPSRPGLVRLTRHPLLLALALWAAAHALANSDLAHVILFGTFAIFASLGGKLVDRRKRQELGPEWGRLDAERRAGPLITPSRPNAAFVLRVGLGIALYLLLILMHSSLFGTSPLI